MKNGKGWIWLLVAAVWVTLGTISLMSSPFYDQAIRWPVAAVVSALLWAAAFYVRGRMKKDDEENTARVQAAADAKQRERDEQLARVRAFRDRHPTIRFAVAGVTFKNEDGTDRQKILQEMSFNESSENDVWFEEDEDLGEESGIRVLTDYGCVGYIRRSDKQMIRRFFDHKVWYKYLEVEQFTNDEGRSIYRADVVFMMDREDPDQKWYFDDLHQS